MNINMTKIWKICMILNIVVGVLDILSYLILPTFIGLFNIAFAGVCIWFCFVRSNPKKYKKYFKSSFILFAVSMFIDIIIRQSLFTFILFSILILYIFINGGVEN